MSEYTPSSVVAFVVVVRGGDGTVRESEEDSVLDVVGVGIAFLDAAEDDNDDDDGPPTDGVDRCPERSIL